MRKGKITLSRKKPSKETENSDSLFYSGEPEYYEAVFPRSCTIEEAILKLLNWMQSPIRKKMNVIDRKGLYGDLNTLHSLNMPLAEFLNDYRENAYTELTWAQEQNASKSAIKAKKDALLFWERAIVEAEIYRVRMESELTRGAQSLLRIDEEATAKTGKPHITVGSLEAWANDRFNKSIISSLEELIGPQKEKAEAEGPGPKGGLSKTVADNLFATFWFAVESIAELEGEVRRLQGKEPVLSKDGRPTKSQVAGHIEEVAVKRNRNKPMKGVTKESILDRIELAERVARDRLPPAKG